MTKAPVIFDLDGTLIDSAPGILESMRAAFAKVDIKPACALEPSIIGPPLKPTLRKLCGGQIDESTVESLAAAFKEHYDAEGYRSSFIIEPMHAIMAALTEQGREMYIVTNKRMQPTQKILEHLAWQKQFIGVYSPDSLTPAAVTKTQVLKHVIAKHGLPASRCWYVGDRDEDFEAAQNAGLPFLRVPWGYGGKFVLTADSVARLRKHLLREPL